MLLMYRIARLLEMNSTSSTLTTRSTVIAFPGTCQRLSLPSPLIVRPAFEIPYSARLPSAVEDDIDRIRLAIRQIRRKVPNVLPAIVWSALE